MSVTVYGKLIFSVGLMNKKDEYKNAIRRRESLSDSANSVTIY